MKSVIALFLKIGNVCTVTDWLIIAATLVWQIRLHLSGILVGSFYSGNIRGATCRKRAKAARKEQSVFRRITMTYIGDYVSDRLRKPYKMYMVFKAVIDIWIILGCIFLVVSEFIEVPYAPLIRGLNISGIAVFDLLLILLYNPNTRETRFLDFMY